MEELIKELLSSSSSSNSSDSDLDDIFKMLVEEEIRPKRLKVENFVNNGVNKNTEEEVLQFFFLIGKRKIIFF